MEEEPQAELVKNTGPVLQKFYRKTSEKFRAIRIRPRSMEVDASKCGSAQGRQRYGQTVGMGLGGNISKKHGFMFPKCCGPRVSLKALKSQADGGVILRLSGNAFPCKSIWK